MHASICLPSWDTIHQVATLMIPLWCFSFKKTVTTSWILYLEVYGYMMHACMHGTVSSKTYSHILSDSHWTKSWSYKLYGDKIIAVYENLKFDNLDSKAHLGCLDRFMVLICSFINLWPCSIRKEMLVYRDSFLKEAIVFLSIPTIKYYHT